MDARKVLKDKITGDLPVALREGETVLARAIISQGIYWKTVSLFVIAILLLLVATPLGVLFLFVSLFAFGYAFMIKHALLMIVTNQRVFVRTGIIKVDTVQLRFDRIESVEIQRTIPGQFLNYATVVVTGIGSRLAYLPYVENAVEIRDILNEVSYKREEKPTHVIVDKITTRTGEE
jgi:uncharacterized membrane protein YdbT with pleckstrin-like domain